MFAPSDHVALLGWPSSLSKTEVDDEQGAAAYSKGEDGLLCCVGVRMAGCAVVPR